MLKLRACCCEFTTMLSTAILCTQHRLLMLLLRLLLAFAAVFLLCATHLCKASMVALVGIQPRVQMGGCRSCCQVSSTLYSSKEGGTEQEDCVHGKISRVLLAAVFVARIM